MVAETRDCTAPYPPRLYLGIVSMVGLAAIVLALLGIGLTQGDLRWAAWVAIALIVVASPFYGLIVWQLLAYRNPVLSLRTDALALYGMDIRWRDIDRVTFGEDRLWIHLAELGALSKPDASRSFMYRFARVVMRRQDNMLLLPKVRELSGAELNEIIATSREPD